MRFPPARLHKTFGALPALTVLLFTGCGDDPTQNRRLPSEILLLSEPDQQGTPGWPLPDSVTVEVQDAQGNPMSGVRVSWTAVNGGDRLGRDADTTDAAGRASVEWTLGVVEGSQTLSVTAGELEPITVTAEATIFHATSVTLGWRFACALSGGTAYCWGINNSGQLGNGTSADPAPTLVPAPVAGDLVFSALASSGAHTCGLTTGGEAYCWGTNDQGETGTGTTGGSVSAPTPVQTALRFTEISAEGTSVINSTCGLTASGEAWCWGDNHYGQLGDGTTTSSAVPVPVQAPVPFSSIQTGYFHSCGVATTGELWCWGEQESVPGAFGESPAGLYPTPVALQDDFRFVRLSTGRNYTCALTAEKAAFCWGADLSNGSLGQDQVFDGSAVPLPVVGGHSFVALSSTNFEETYALTGDGAVYRWGSPGNDVPQAPPVLLARTGFIQIDGGDDPFVGGSGACGITAGQAVYCVAGDGFIRGVPQPAMP